MKKPDNQFMNRLIFKTAGLLLTALPATGFAQTASQNASPVLPVEMNMTTFLVMGGLLVLSITMFFVFQHRFKIANKQLQDITTELGHTRERLTETSHTLESTQVDLKNTTNRYQGILFDAEAGMFQMDLNGKCSYVNTTMQNLSGLYPKKALKEGLLSAVHPDDRDAFKSAWEAFTTKDEPFHVQCRFKHAKGREVHVDCRANKVINEKKEIESYIGWVSDVTPYYEEQLVQQAHTARYESFIDETIEGYYRLTPETPIPLTGTTDKIVDAIMDQMTLEACNDTFASMYGKTTAELKGSPITSLQDGCGPFKNKDAVKAFIENEFKALDFESIRQDPRGNRLNLLNNVVGLIEDKKLIGIWGSQRNISQQKRELAELKSQATFMQRILNALPADVHVKDTRCRYLYASKKLSDRTGIPQEDWIGKTVFEVMPATARDHDKTAIDVMKANKMSLSERPYEARGKSGWLETIHSPLVSGEGLVEGVIGLSFEVTARKKKEEEANHYRKQVEQQLKQRTTELSKTQQEHGATAIALRDTNQKLRIREAELENQTHEFKEKLTERKRAEDLLRRNEESLLTRQTQLEKQLQQRLAQLDQETDKRKKWEELLAIKDDELVKLEKSTQAREQQLEQEIDLREKREAELSTSQLELQKTLNELQALETARKTETDSLVKKHETEFNREHSIRQQAESQLKKTDELLKNTQTQVKELLQQHAAELEHEITERKAAATQLIKSSEELIELKRQFNVRIEDETKSLKQQLSQKQIREKTLREHEKDLEARIKGLEKSLREKTYEYQEQIQAREATEAERSQAEQKLNKLNSRQKELIERETHKLNLNVAEIRLEEVRLRKQVGDLEQANEELEGIIETRNKELATAIKEQKNLEDALSGTKDQIQQLIKDQEALIAKETATLQDELKQLKQKETDLLKEEAALNKQSALLEETIEKLTTELEAEKELRKSGEEDLNNLKIAFDASQENAASLIEKHTKDLNQTIEQHKQNEVILKKSEEKLQQETVILQKTIDTRTAELAEAREEREKAELELVQTIERSGQSAKEIEAKIAEIKQEHLNEIQQIKDEQKELRDNEKHYRSLFQSSADAFLQIDPKNGKILSANLAAAHLFGEETTNILADKTLDALSPKQQENQSPSADMAKARLHSTLETGHDSFEWIFVKSDEEDFTALVSLSTIQIEEKQLILAIIKDISSIKKQQAKLEQTIREAHAANQINSNIVDEVNEVVQTSLHPVIETSSALEKADNISDHQKSEMASINRNCRTLVDMLNYRAELSHVADGSDDTQAVKCDLHGLIKELDEQYCERAATKKLFFAVSYAQYQSANNVPKFIETDEQKVRKTLEILLGYALSHTDKGRLGLHAACKSNEGESLVSFEMAYTGAEKHDELLSRVFDPSNADHSDDLDMKYGLSLARRYVAMLDGSIELEYRQGNVTSLTIEFPFKKVTSEIVMPGKDTESKEGAA